MSRITLVVLVASALLSFGVASLDAQVCGNGIREAGEQCDDGNTTNLDGCSAQCKFEQSQRINALKMQFATAATCTANRLGAAFGGNAQAPLQTVIDGGVSSGSTSVIFNMIGLDDLTGTTDATVQVGVINGTHALPAPGGMYNGNNDLDWWYTIDPLGIDGARIPLSKLTGSIAAQVLSTLPGSVTLTVAFGPIPTQLRMSSLRLTATNGATSTPQLSVGVTPPGHLLAEHLDPALVSYASSGAGVTGELCGNLSAASMAQIPAPTALQAGPLACSENYTITNSLLDVIVGGCHVSILTLVTATQPDQQDASVPAAGAGGLYTLSAGSNHVVNNCHDKNGTTVTLATCLTAAAYSSFFKFSTDRVIAGRTTPPTISQINPNAGSTNGGQSVTITGADLDGATIKVDATTVVPDTASSGSLTFTTPAHAAGAVDVVVTTLGGSATAAYTYVAPPAAPAGVTAAAVSSTRVNIGWTPVSGADSYQVDRMSPGGGFVMIGTTTTNSLSDTSLSAGTSYLYRVRAVNVGGPSPNSAPDLATTLFMTNDPLTSTTPIRAVHLSQLRTAVNAVRTLANLGAAVTTDPAVAGTLIKAIHVMELRVALDQARGMLGLSTGGYTDPSLSGISVKAIHFQELRDKAGTTPLQPFSTGMTVNEVSTGKVSSASDEFIELFNASVNTVDLSDWTVVYRAATAVSDTLLATIPPGTTIEPSGFYLLGGSAYTGAAVADQTFTNGLAAVGGAVGIRNAAGNLVDSVGWGTATNALIETTAATAPAAGSSIGRQPDGTDSNNNATDFKVSAALTPRAPNQ